MCRLVIWTPNSGEANFIRKKDSKLQENLVSLDIFLIQKKMKNTLDM